MKKYFLIPIIIAIVFIFIYMNKEEPVVNVEKEGYDIEADNSASKMCHDLGGEIEMRFIEDKSYKYCVFEDGTECEEWDLLGGRCNNDFCGASTYSECKNDYDCIKDGCSSEICKGRSEDNINSDCDFKDCYNNEVYNLECKCIDSQCQWYK